MPKNYYFLLAKCFRFPEEEENKEDKNSKNSESENYENNNGLISKT